MREEREEIQLQGSGRTDIFFNGEAFTPNKEKNVAGCAEKRSLGVGQNLIQRK